MSKKSEPAASTTEIKNGIVVENPLVIRPVDLPLVVKPEDGKWKNEAQEKYAKVLNAYAYTNTKKWEKKKGVLIDRLVEIGEDPSALEKYQPSGGSVTFKNKLVQQ